MRQFRYFVLTIALLALPGPARGQYVFLDANGDGVHDAADQLNLAGTTELDVWFYTDENADGSAAVCVTDPSEPLTINSYEIVLRVENGRIEFGPMRNRIPFSAPPACFATYEDTTSTTGYHNGWGYRDIFPPGRYRVATLTVRVLEGNPTLVFDGRSRVQPTDLTSFGTSCAGADFDNTYVLGEEFQDAAGIGPPIAIAGGPYRGVVGAPIQFDGSASRDPEGLPLTYDWAFDDGGAATGAVAFHTFGDAGDHAATLTVSNGSATATDTAPVRVAEPYVPIAAAGGPYRGIPGVAVRFDASASFDPDGDPLSYAWDFGDGGRAGGMFPAYIYAAPGTYAVTLDVSDGMNSSRDETTAAIAAPTNHAPVVTANGPYEGVVGRWIEMNAIGSSDADGDQLTFQWDFGDQTHGLGIVTAHAYRAAGAYTIRVTGSDGLSNTAAETTARIGEGYDARAFLDGGGEVVSLDDGAANLVVRVEPVEGSFRSIDVDPDLVGLSVQRKDGVWEAIPALDGVIEQGDSDGNGVAELVALVPLDRLRELADAGAIGGRTHLQVTGILYRGGSFLGSFDAVFARASRFDVTVTPNPFNPLARLVLHTRSRGEVTLRLYDVRGRRVRTLWRGVPMEPGRHELVFEARDDEGAVLPSGVYFMHAVGPDGAVTGRVVVAK